MISDISGMLSRTYFKECECASGFSSMTLVLNPSMLFFFNNWKYIQEVCGECFTFWDCFLWIYMDFSSVNCSWCVLWGAEECVVHSWFPSLLTLSGDRLWRTEGLSCFSHKLYLPSELSIYFFPLWYSEMYWLWLILHDNFTFLKATLTINGGKKIHLAFDKFKRLSIRFLLLLLLPSQGLESIPAVVRWRC